MTVPAAETIAADDRRAWSDAHVQPLWEIGGAHNDAVTERHAELWPWRTMQPLVERACALASPAVAERRVLSLIAPDARAGEFHTITNLNAGLQIILPGEVARPHRHSMDALRFVLEGNGAVTRVDGIDAPMMRGDLVLTPGWCWHEHWHEGAAPIVWLDVLNVHAHINLETFAFEPGPPHDVPARSPETVFRYPLADMLRALESASPAGDGSRRVRYVNPLTDGPVMPLLDCWMLRLEAGRPTVPFRTSAHAVCAVVAGRGTTRTGSASIAWQRNDVFTLPHDTPIEHEAGETSLLFVVSDREVYRRLDLLTETYGDRPEVRG